MFRVTWGLLDSACGYQCVALNNHPCNITTIMIMITMMIIIIIQNNDDGDDDDDDKRIF